METFDDKTIIDFFKAILFSDNPSEKEAWIRKNEPQIIALIRKLFRTILLVERSNEANEPLIEIAADQIDLLKSSYEYLAIISSTVFPIVGAQPENPICKAIMENHEFFIHLNHRMLHCKNDIHGDNRLAILVNFTRQAYFVNYLVEKAISYELDKFLSEIIKRMTVPDETSSISLTYYLNNLCQSEKVRHCLAEHKFFLKILDIFDHSSNNVRLRHALIELIRNCCLHYDIHSLMISPNDIELLVRLVLPLAGPEEFPEDETESLPIDLQYLPVDKKRENDPEIRRLLIEAIHQLCSTRYGREIIRNSNIYYILREYHRWEQNPDVSETLMQLIDVIIKKEDEINVDNLKELSIPDDLVKEFEKIDQNIQSEQGIFKN